MSAGERERIIGELAEQIRNSCGDHWDAGSMIDRSVRKRMGEVWDAAIERAAQEALREKVAADETGDAGDAAYNLALEHAAVAIRELKGQ